MITGIRKTNRTSLLLTVTQAGIAVVLTIASLNSLPALGQVAQHPEDPSATVCVMRERVTGEVVQTFLPARHVPEMLRGGYSLVPCQQAFSNEAEMIAWRDEVCRMASINDRGLQLQLEGILGKHAAVLCGLAESIKGRWTRSEGSVNGG